MCPFVCTFADTTGRKAMLMFCGTLATALCVPVARVRARVCVCVCWCMLVCVSVKPPCYDCGFGGRTCLQRPLEHSELAADGYTTATSTQFEERRCGSPGCVLRPAPPCCAVQFSSSSSSAASSSSSSSSSLAQVLGDGAAAAASLLQIRSVRVSVRLCFAGGISCDCSLLTLRCVASPNSVSAELFLLASHSVSSRACCCFCRCCCCRCCCCCCCWW